jgi:hypothetical protein
MNNPNMMNGTLPQAERDKLEERIIAYFEGSLDGESSTQLLREVGESAAKRSLFHSYEVLDRVIAAARTPLEAPLEVKRGIVERIPGLLAWIPGLLGTAPAIPVITQSASPIVGFLSKIPLSTAISVGTSAVVLTTAGVIIKNKLDDNAAQEARQRTANVRTYEAPQSSTPHTYAPLESRELSSNLGNPGTAAVAEASNATETSVKSHSNASSQIASTHTVAPVEHTTKAENNSASNVPVAHKPVESQPIAARNEPKDETPSLMSVQPLAISSVKANTNVILNQGSVLKPLPVAMAEGMTYRFFGYTGVRMTALNVVNGAPSKMRSAFNVAGGVDIPLADKLSVTGKIGYTSFAHAENDFGQDSRSSSVGLPIYGTHTDLSNNQQVWTTAGLSYELLKLGDYSVLTSLDLGTVFFQHQVGMLGAAGLATEIPLSTAFVLRPMLTYDLVHTTVEDAQTNQRAPRGAILMDNKATGQVWTSAIGFGLTFTTRF